MSGVRSFLIYSCKKWVRRWWELPGMFGTLQRSLVRNETGSSHNPVSGYSLSPIKTKLQKATMRQIFSKAKICLQTRDAGRRDWRWKCDLKLPSPKRTWLWTECLKDGAVSRHNMILMAITATNTAGKSDFVKKEKPHCENVWPHKKYNEYPYRVPLTSAWHISYSSWGKSEVNFLI